MDFKNRNFGKKPIAKTFRDLDNLPLVYDHQVVSRHHMEQNHIITHDSLYSNALTFEGDFYDINYSDTFRQRHRNPSNAKIATFVDEDKHRHKNLSIYKSEFLMYPKVKYHKRKVYNIIDLLKDCGGYLTSFMAICKVIVVPFSYFNF